MSRIGLLELKRSLFTWKILVCASAICIVFFLDRVNYWDYYSDVISLMKSQSSYKEVFPVIAALPFGASFAQDYSSGAYKSLIIKSSTIQYAQAKLHAIVISTLLTYILSQVMVFLVGTVRLPICSDLNEAIWSYDIYYLGLLLKRGYIIAFLLVQISVTCCVYILYICVSAWLSTVIPNVLFTTCTPLFINYVLVYVCWYAGVPASYNVEFIERGLMTTTNAGDTVILFFAILLAVGFGKLFVYGIRRRVNNA